MKILLTVVAVIHILVRQQTYGKINYTYMYTQSPSIYRLTTVHAFQVLYSITRPSEIGANTTSTLPSLSTTTTIANSSVTSIISITTDKPQAGTVSTMTEYQTTTVPFHSTPFIGSGEMIISRGLHIQSMKTAKSTVNRDTSLVSMVPQYSTTTLESEERTTVTAGSLTGRTNKYRLHTEVQVSAAQGGVNHVEIEPRCVTNLYHGL